MSEMSNTISLVLGDWSGDGHEKTETIVLRSNLTNKQIEDAYKKGTNKVGFDFIRTIANEYEDNVISAEKLDALIELGLKDFDRIGDDTDEDDYNLDTDSFADIYLFIVKLGNEDFEYKILVGESNPEIRIGGYGLFY
jgi:hypothetical protein